MNQRILPKNYKIRIENLGESAVVVALSLWGSVVLQGQTRKVLLSMAAVPRLGCC